MPVCTPGCGKNVPSRLSSHRRNCEAYKSAHRQNLQNLRLELEADSEDGRVRKRARFMDDELATGSDNAADSEASGRKSTSLPGQSSHPNHDISSPLEGIPLNDLDDIMDPLPSPEPAIPAFSVTGHPQRQTRRPARFQDVLPESSAFISPLSLSTPTPPIARIVRLIVRDTLWTDYNAFGLRRHYMHRPTYEPDAFLTPEDLLAPDRRTAQSNAPVHIPLPTLTTSSTLSPTVTAELPPPWPLANMSKWLLMRWANNGKTTKSASEIDSLVNDVIMDPAFNAADLHGFRSETENARLDREADVSDHPLFQSFKETTVHIEVPSGEPGVHSQPFPVPGLLHRKLTDVITAAFQETLSFRMHLSPHKIFHRSPGATEDIRVYGEMYTSDVFLEADDDVRLRGKLPPGQQGCTLEKIVAAMMLFSDATHLASFGNAKAWPIYLALGNLSKYVRACPTSDSMFHIAYIPSLPDSFQDWVTDRFPHWGQSKSATKNLKTLCRRELMQSVWETLLDDDFIHAYMYGIVIECKDGIKRRVYPRIFTYSADYPEKVLLATIRDQGGCPCPRCLVPKAKLDLVGQKRDGVNRIKTIREYLKDKVIIARDAIYRLGRAINSTVVDNLLKESSHVPTMSAFVKRLGDDFNPFKMLVVDQLHEIELGVWKALFVHLIRILYAFAKRSKDSEVIAELDRRYRLIKSFGRGTIRRFSANSSEMKKLAARDYEDLLQCSIPVFEGLLPEPFNSKLITLLYRFAEWHAFSKLRMHTDTTLSWFEKSTQTLGALLRDFRDKVCPEFETFELPREAAARSRAALQRQDAQGGATSTSDVAAANSTTRRKVFNLMTYKFHAMGDYVSHVRRFGTLDSYSTQMGELAHRLVKSLYSLTNKKDGAMKQVAKKYSRSRALKQMTATKEEVSAAEASSNVHYFISDNVNSPIDIFQFVQGSEDPAKKRFIPKLKDHLFGRLKGLDFDGDETQFTDMDRNHINLVGNRIYKHNIMRINYTTYDIRRDYDTINPNSQCFVMLKSPDDNDDAHPYWYAQVLGVYHAKVQHIGPDSTDPRPQVMHFLYVRWLGEEVGWKSGRRRARLPKIGFVPDDDPYAFGFLDPDLVIRGTHLIPSFVNGCTDTLLATNGETLARSKGETLDWTNYYVNIFVDRDMVMRYFGGGIGHAGSSPIRREDNSEPEEGVSDETEDSDGEGEGDMDNVQQEQEQDAEDDEEEEEDDEEDDLDLDDDSGGSDDDIDDGYDEL